MKILLVLALLLSFSLLSSANNYQRDGEDNVILLDTTNFEQFISSPQPVLVSFVSPSCGWCHRLAPEFAAAADYLEPRGIQLARVDAAQHSDLREIYGIASFPTIVKFQKGKFLEKYSGGRSMKDLVEYMIGFAPTNPKINSEEELLELRKSIDTNYLVYYGPGQGNIYNRIDTLQRSGELSRLQIVESYAAEEKAILYLRYSVAVLQGLAEGIVLTPGQIVASTIKTLVAPRIVEFKNPSWFSDPQIHSPLPALRIFLSMPSDFEAKKSLYAALLPVAEKYKGKLIFSFNDKEIYTEDVSYYGLSGSTSFAIFDFGKGKVYMGEGGYTPEKVAVLVEAFLNQEAVPLIRKSEPIPTGQEGKLIQKVVAANFHEVVWKYGVDVFFFVRTAQVEHSNALRRVFEQAVKEVVEEKTFEGLDVVFAEFDSTLNELPISYEVTLASWGGEPTIFAASSGAKIGPVAFDEEDFTDEDIDEGEYTVESVKEFFKENSHLLEDKILAATKQRAKLQPKVADLKDEL